MQEGDTVEFHFQDTMLAGDGLCSETAVRVLVEEGPVRIKELVAWGARFDQDGGRFIFGREGAHSRNRILHSGDATGLEIVRALLNWVQQTPGIRIVMDRPAVDLIIIDGRCAGVTTMDEGSGELSAALAPSVVLATGGAGQIYSHTTNPPVATGDGVAMAHRAGADTMDLEFYQFHPTAFHLAGAPRFLLTEALRGEGAVLKNIHGKTFMDRYHPMAELAPRDVVSRAIAGEINKTQSAWVYLDATSIGRKKLRGRFPNIYEFLQKYELDLSVDLIPVSPSAHYWMGGVRTDLFARTSIPGLYAAGEVACNGVHGANRLASNSLLEGLVFGARAAQAILQEPALPTPAFEPAFRSDSLFTGDVKEVRTAIQTMNWENLGLIRNEQGMTTLLNYLNGISRFMPQNIADQELLNLLDCSTLMCSFALQRQESRGSHYREDYPSPKPEWEGRHTVMRKGTIELEKS